MNPPRRIKITSDGTGPGTSIVDADTGKDLAEHCVEVTWTVRVDELARVTLVMDGCAIDIDVVGEES